MSWWKNVHIGRVQKGNPFEAWLLHPREEDEVTMGWVFSYLPSRRLNVLIPLSHVIELRSNLLPPCSL